MKHPWSYIAMMILLAGCVGARAPSVIATATEAPSTTPTSAETLTPTLLPELPLATSTPESPAPSPTSSTISASDLECRVRSQAIRDGAKFDPKEYFDMGWMVKNIGTVTWDPANVEFTYWSGSRLHVSDRSQLSASVAPGDSILLVADMVAPKSSGNYTTVWSLRQGEIDFCHVSLMITVR